MTPAGDGGIVAETIQVLERGDGAEFHRPSLASSLFDQRVGRKCDKKMIGGQPFPLKFNEASRAKIPSRSGDESVTFLRTSLNSKQTAER